MKLTKVQLQTLVALSQGRPFCEYLTPARHVFFRTLGRFVPARLNYVLDGKRVTYETFRALFKLNLITPSRYKGDLSPEDGITQFYATKRGLQVCKNKGRL